MSPLPEDLKVYLSWVGCLDLVVESIKFLLDAILGGGVQHLSTIRDVDGDQAMKKILLFCTFSPVTKSKS